MRNFRTAIVYLQYYWRRGQDVLETNSPFFGRAKKTFSEKSSKFPSVGDQGI